MSSSLSNIRKLLICALLSLPLAAQTGLGIVTGTVMDSSRAVVPKASVTLTNTATGVVRTAAANDSGIYYFGSLRVGPYHLSIAADGFDKFETNFVLQAGQTVTVDSALTVGTVSTTVDVGAAAAPIATEGSQLSDVKTAQTIHDLPLNGRQISNLFTLTPGVEGGQNTQGGANMRTNGMMVGSTDILIDGMSYVDRFGGGIARVQPGLDTVQEYRVETAGSGAAYDRPATVSLVTRSGTNEFHGGAFETLRDNYGGLVARAVQDGNNPAKLIRNEFGGFVGGPVIKNKTFFFYDQELLKQRSQIFAQTAVPTAAMWGGDLSNITDSSGNHYTLYNPYTTDAAGNRQPFPNNVIPSNMLNKQIIDGLRAATPLPSGPNASANPWLGNNFQTFYPQSTNTNSITARGDQVFSDKNSLSVRYTGSTYNYLQAGGRYAYPPPGVSNAAGTAAQQAKAYNITAHYTHVFSPTLMNDLQLAANRSPNSQGTGSDNVDWADKLGFPNPFGAKGWPTIGMGNNMLYYGYWDNDNHKAQHMTQYQIDDNVTWVKGKHTFKFGFKGRSEYNNVEELQQAQGSNSFGANWTGLYSAAADGITPFTGSGLASLELGLPNYLSNQYNRGYFYFQQKDIGVFGEDTWRVTPKLTVSLGLRWEYWSPYREKYDRMDNLDLASLTATNMQVVLPHNATLASAGVPQGVIDAWSARGLTSVSADSIKFPSALTPNVWRDFAPRIAAAYRLTDRTVLRGGYGVYYFPMPLSQLLQSMRSNPPLNLRYENDVDSNQGTNGNYSLTVVPASSDTLGAGGSATVSPSAVSSSSQSFLAMDVNRWADNKIQEWTATVERELPHHMVLKVSYAGNHGSNLQQHWDFNSPTSRYNYQAETGLAAPVLAYQRQYNPNWNTSGAYGILAHNGYSNSHSLQVVLDKRYSNGLSFQAYYAFTRSMATTDPGGFSSGGAGLNSGVATGAGSQGGGVSGTVPANNEILGNPNMSDSQRLRLLYTNSSQVPPQRITWTGIYELPFGKGKKYLSGSGRALDAVVGGWQIGFVGTWSSGFWMGVNSNGEYLFGDPTLSSDKRLNLSYAGQNRLLWFAGDFDPTQASNVNASALQAIVPVDRGARMLHPLGSGFNNLLPQTLANGTTVMTPMTDNLSWNSRNFMLGPSAWNQDISVFKYFSITERIRLRMSGDFFNSFNHPNLNNPDATTGLINLSSQPNAPRIIQVGARVEF
jgi:hypothetical protein